MYSISNEYRTKMLDQVQTHKLSGTLDGSIPFSDSSVIGVSIQNQCSDKNVNVGSVNIGVLKLTFLSDLLNRGDYYGKEIALSDSLLTGYTDEEEEIWEDIPLGVFRIAEATWRAEGMIDVIAYDCLSQMDEPITPIQTSGYLYDFCKLVETETGAEFGMTREECEALPNGDIIISPYTENDMTTWRDMVSKLAQLVGGFGYADRDGTWRLKSFNNTSVLNVPVNRRMSGSKFSDFTTRFDGMSWVDVKTTGETYYVGDSNGFTMELGNNPFLQYGGVAITKGRVQTIFSTVQTMIYTPFEVSGLPALVALDLGDVVSFTDDYTGHTSIGAVMAITWTYNKSFKMVCYGSNPNLSKAQSKTDKAIAGNKSQNSKDKISTYTSANITEIEVGSELQEITRTYFTTASEQPMLTLTEVKFNLDSSGQVELVYFLDNEQINYIPTETYSESGLHTVSFMFPIEGASTDFKHKFQVFMRAASGATIEPLDARTYIQGYGYDLTSEWVGILEADDTITIVPIGKAGVLGLTETITHSFANNSTEQASDNLTILQIEQLRALSILESVAIFMHNLCLATESELFLLTEDEMRIELD